mmetsp:Transcript_62884/g.166845  ORF Transcript_62884/g.166845 Transcript_62884/m.166845 type:complete len:240 (-) Transcript_62884:55-774(-)
MLDSERPAFLGHAHRVVSLHRQLIACIAITRVTVHFVNTMSISACIGTAIINVPAHLFSADHFHLETRSAAAAVIHVRIDATSVRTASVPTNNAVVYRHTLTHDREDTHCITNSGTNQLRRVRGPVQRKPIEAMEMQGLEVTYITQLRLRVGRPIRSGCSVTRKPESRLGTLDWRARLRLCEAVVTTREIKLFLSSDCAIDTVTNHTVVGDRSSVVNSHATSRCKFDLWWILTRGTPTF